MFCFLQLIFHFKISLKVSDPGTFVVGILSFLGILSRLLATASSVQCFGIGSLNYFLFSFLKFAFFLSFRYGCGVFTNFG